MSSEIINVETINSIFALLQLVWGGVQLGPLGMAAIDWPIVACPG
jgi:hypothetical protein